jgi:asparagine synthase (glutamine-hydrolysing)
MAHSVEIRVPYVDPFFLAALPPGEVLAAIKAKEAIADVPQPPLPAASRDRAKTGFTTPVGRWIRDASGPADDTGFSGASRAWASRVWQAGWTGCAA